MTPRAEPAGSKRRHPRIALPRGIPVAWSGGGRRGNGLVTSLSAGGLLIAATAPAPAGAEVELLFDVPWGEVRARARVQRLVAEGMGLEFTHIAGEERARLAALLEKLLG